MPRKSATASARAVTSARVGPPAAPGDVFRAIADPTRRAILDRLRTAAAPVNSLAMDFDMTRPAVSKHLRVLREAHLVTEAREGRERVYQLRPGPLREVASFIERYRVFWLDGLNQLKRMLEAEEEESR